MGSWPAALGIRRHWPGARRWAAWSRWVRNGSCMVVGAMGSRVRLAVTTTGPSAVISSARPTMPSSIPANTSGDGSRNCTDSRARPGTMLSAPGSTSTRPVVHTVAGPASAATHALSRTPNSNSATDASRRRSIGVVPAWFCSPVNSICSARIPTIEVTTPMRSPPSSRCGPCSMWASRYPMWRSGSNRPSGSDASPTRSRASATDSPLLFSWARTDGVSPPTKAVLPRQLV